MRPFDALTRRGLRALLAAILLPAASALAEEAARDIRLGPNLGLERLSDLAEQIDAPIVLPNRGELRLRSGWKDEGRGVPTCRAYFEARSASLRAFGALDEALEELVKARCIPLRALTAARPSQTSHLLDFTLALEDLRLPIEIAPLLLSEETEMAELLYARGRTWRQMFRQASFEPRDPTQLVVDNGGLEMTYTLLAWADFDGDGLEDALLSIRTAATNGSRRPIRHVILSRKGPASDLELARELE